MVASELRSFVIRPVIEYLGMYSESAVELLIGTAAVETNLGEHLKQVEGPALGIYQIEPATHDDLWENWLHAKADTTWKVMNLIYPFGSKQDQVIANLSYATAVARCIYRRVPEPLPHMADVVGMAQYWKHYWNTPAGAGTVDRFVDAYLQWRLT